MEVEKSLKHIVSWVAVLLQLHVPAVLLSSEADVVFSNYSTPQGLVHKTVTCILRDRDGFLWTGTTNGLSRFDGYTFKNFITDEDDSLALHGAIVSCIAEGLDGKIWLSTDKGIEYFDKHTETFHLVSVARKESNLKYTNICVDDKGAVWSYNATSKFTVFIPHKNNIKSQKVDFPLQAGGISSLPVYRFHVLNNAVWIASSKGIIKFDYQKRRLTCVDSTLDLNFCFSIKQVGNSELAFTYMYDGVYLLNTTTLEGTWVMRDYLKGKHSSQVFLVDAVKMDDGALWIGATPGLSRVEKVNGDKRNSYNISTFLDADVLSCLYKDSENTLWIGTYEDGIYYSRDNSNKFNTISGLCKGEPARSSISNIQVFDDGSLLYSDSRGFYACKDYRHLSAGCATKLASATLPAIYAIDGRCCFARSNDSLYLYDSRAKSFSLKLRSPATQCAYFDKNNIIWLGTWDNGLVGYDLKTNKKYNLIIDSLDKTNNAVFTMCGDADGSLWLGGYGAGLVHVFDPTSRKPRVERFVHIKGENSISKNVVLGLYDDGKGCLWIGTCGGGLNRFNKSSKRFDVFTVKQGLRSNVIESVTSDLDGNIWFASNVLSKYDVRTGEFTHYSTSDGVMGGFVAKACARSRDGYLFFGNTRGLMAFSPASIPAKAAASTPLLTGFRLRGLAVEPGDTVDGIVPCTRSITFSRSTSLPYFLNTFAIEFASIQFHDSQNISYKYMLEGVDRSWIPADSRNRLASYSGLQPGKYTFKVRASNGSAAWSEARVLAVEIVPPWWQTWWFRTGFVLLCLSVVTSIVFYRFRAIKRQNILLEEKVNERTGALVRANEHMKENQIVIEMKNLQLGEALQAKDQLISVLAHDFKNPMTGLLGISALLKNESLKSKEEKVLRYAESIFNTATSLVNQMMTVIDWAQGHDEQINTNPVEINIEVLVDDAISLVKESALLKEISVSKQYEYTTNALVDPRMASTVFRNLLTNAIKFTPRGGSVLVAIQELDNAIDVAFIDTGLGMSEDRQSTIFEGNATTPGTDNEKGSGLGLRLCKLFVEKNSGTIGVASHEGEGSVFTVSLPKGINKATPKLSPTRKEDITSFENAPSGSQQFSILIIDDNPGIIEVVQGLFEPRVAVMKALDGREGLYLAQNMLPDIIISDINLPGKNGIEICKTLKSNPLTSHIPVLLITSQKDAELQEASYRSGAIDFIEKPFNPFALKQKVESLLEYHRTFMGNAGSKNQESKTHDLPPNYDSKIIKKVMDLVQENISEPNLDTNAIANRVGISRMQLWRIFKNSTGKPLGDYIRETRMQKAAGMLATGRYRIYEVAYEVGYSDPKYFTKCFTKEFGMSPTAYAGSAGAKP